MRHRTASHQTSRRNLLALGLLGIGTAAALVVFGVNSPNGIPTRSYYDLDVAFADADNISIHSQVRVGGRTIGQVLHPRVQDGQAVITLQLNPDVQPLLSDTEVKIRPRSAIGVRYVEVHPGTTGTPLADGGSIPISQTGATRPLDEALSTFDPRTRATAQTMLHELGGGVAGRGEELNTALGDVEPLVRHLGGAMQAVAARRQATAGFVRGADTAATAVDPVREEFTRGFSPEADVAEAFAAERHALHDTLAAAPPALNALDDRLAATRPLVRDVGTLARAALPALRSAPASLRSATRMLAVAGPVLEHARPTLIAADAAVPTTLKLLRGLRPELGPLEQAFDDATPIVDNLAPRYCDMRNMLGGWGSMMEYGNAAGNYLRFNIEAAAESVQGFQTQDTGVLGVYDNPYPAPCQAGTEGAAR